MGWNVGRFAGGFIHKGRQVISDALHGHRTIQESGRESGYRRFREKGRMAPDGLAYVESWVETNFDRCFQLMECGDVRLLNSGRTAGGISSTLSLSRCAVRKKRPSSFS